MWFDDNMTQPPADDEEVDAGMDTGAKEGEEGEKAEEPGAAAEDGPEMV